MPIHQRPALAVLTLACSQLIFSSATSAEMEQITTTASRTVIETKEAGSALTILDRDFINRSNATSLADLLREVPGLSISQQGSRGAITQLRVRGAEANHVLVLINGMEANDLSQGGEFNFAHLLVDSIERVEIVRGPQSALWGSDAVAGVVNVITYSQESTDNLNIGVEGGSFGSQKLSGGFNKTNELGGITLQVTDYRTEGTNISRQGNEKDGYENTTLQLDGFYHLSDQASLIASIRHTNSTIDFDGTDFITTGLPTDADYTTDSEQTYGQVSLLVSQANDALRHQITLARIDTDNENFTGSLVNDITQGEKLHLGYQLTGSVGNHTLSGIAEYEKEDFTQRGLASVFGDPNRDENIDTKSLAAEYRYSVQQFNLAASLRRDKHSEFDGATTYRLSGVWHTPAEGLDLYGAYGRASKNPTFTERFGYYTNFIGNPGLKPEYSRGWELGLRNNSFMDGNLYTALSYFSTKLEDEINGFVFDTATGGYTAANRIGESERQGAEFEFALALTEHSGIRGSYAYIDSNSEDASGTAIDEVRRPRHSGALSGYVEWQRASLSLSATYTGEQLDDYFPPVPPYQERVTLDSFLLLSLSASYRWNEQLSFHFRADNLLDEDYEEVYGYVSPGAGFHGGMKYQF